MKLNHKPNLQRIKNDWANGQIQVINQSYLFIKFTCQVSNIQHVLHDDNKKKATSHVVEATTHSHSANVLIQESIKFYNNFTRGCPKVSVASNIYNSHYNTRHNYNIMYLEYLACLTVS